MARKAAKSPYQKYNKRPYRYSPLYEEWFRATIAGKTYTSQRLGREHSELHLGRAAYARSQRRFTTEVQYDPT